MVNQMLKLIVQYQKVWFVKEIEILNAITLVLFVTRLIKTVFLAIKMSIVILFSIKTNVDIIRQIVQLIGQPYVLDDVIFEHKFLAIGLEDIVG